MHATTTDSPTDPITDPITDSAADSTAAPNAQTAHTSTAPTLSPRPLPPAVQALMRVADKPPPVFVRGQGSWLWDSEGHRHLDLVQGWAVNALGHAPEVVADALSTQARTLLQAGPGFHNAPAAQLAQTLATASGLDQVFITTSGAEANEGAVKLARKHGRLRRGGADHVITFGHSFHGRTLAMMAASGKPGFDRIYTPAVPGFIHCPYNDLAAVQAVLEGAQGPQVAAVMLELVQGEAGVVAAETAFVQGLRALCDAHGLLLVVDEVQTGIGRCGSLFAFQQHGLAPDVVTLGKGLGGGVPVGAVLARASACLLQPGDQGGTYNGNALVCAAASAVLGTVAAPEFLQTVQQRGAQLARGLAALSTRHGLGAVRGQGLLRALDLPPSLRAADVAQAGLALPHGDRLLVNPVQPQRLRLMPALNITADELRLCLRLLDQALSRSARAA